MQPTHFQNLVYQATRKIPKGKVSTYADIARTLKNPRSCRAVGNALNKNPFAPKVPCHRVVKSDGTLGGFASGCQNKIKLLNKEGVRVKGSRILNFKMIKFCFK